MPAGRPQTSTPSTACQQRCPRTPPTSSDVTSRARSILDSSPLVRSPGQSMCRVSFVLLLKTRSVGPRWTTPVDRERKVSSSIDLQYCTVQCLSCCSPRFACLAGLAYLQHDHHTRAAAARHRSGVHTVKGLRSVHHWTHKLWTLHPHRQRFAGSPRAVLRWHGGRSSMGFAARPRRRVGRRR